MGLNRRRRRIGLLGGSFDPIHIGHVALARAACEALELDALRLLPTGHAWQKSDAAASGAHRAAMVRLAIRNEPNWLIDTREIERAGASYSVDTLAALRTELGPDCSLILILGSDQLRRLHTWHRWTDLCRLAHIAATQRERVTLADLPEPVEQLLARRGADRLSDAPAGSIVFFSMPPVPVSSTRLRAELVAGQRPVELLPAGVLDYIDEHQLYRGADPVPAEPTQEI